MSAADQSAEDRPSGSQDQPKPKPAQEAKPNPDQIRRRPAVMNVFQGSDDPGSDYFGTDHPNDRDRRR